MLPVAPRERYELVEDPRFRSLRRLPVPLPKRSKHFAPHPSADPVGHRQPPDSSVTTLRERIGLGSKIGESRRPKDLIVVTTRHGDLDGRGARSDETLREFTRLFLELCIDQVTFMESLLQPSELLRRMKLHVDDEIAAGHLSRGSLALLREAFLAGELERGRAGELTGYRERRGRQILATLIERGVLVPQGARAPVRLGFPLDVLERWFPRLYPVD